MDDITAAALCLPFIAVPLIVLVTIIGRKVRDAKPFADRERHSVEKRLRSGYAAHI